MVRQAPVVGTLHEISSPFDQPKLLFTIFNELSYLNEWDPYRRRNRCLCAVQNQRIQTWDWFAWNCLFCSLNCPAIGKGTDRNILIGRRLVVRSVGIGGIAGMEMSSRLTAPANFTRTCSLDVNREKSIGIFVLRLQKTVQIGTDRVK